MFFFTRMMVILYMLSIISFAWIPHAEAGWGVEIVTDIHSPCYASHPGYGSYYCGTKTNTRYEYESPPEPPAHYWYYLDRYNRQIPVHVEHPRERRNKRLVIFRKESTCMECDFGVVY